MKSTVWLQAVFRGVWGTSAISSAMTLLFITTKHRSKEICGTLREIHASSVGRTKATSASDHMPSAPWVLSSAGKLIWSDIYTCPISCLIVPQIFSSFVSVFHLYLSVTRLGCSLNALSSISRVDTPLTADWLQGCFGTLPDVFEKLLTLPLKQIKIINEIKNEFFI